MFVCLSIGASICPSLCLSVHPSICPSVGLSIHLSKCQSANSSSIEALAVYHLSKDIEYISLSTIPTIIVTIIITIIIITIIVTSITNITIGEAIYINIWNSSLYLCHHLNPHHHCHCCCCCLCCSCHWRIYRCCHPGPEIIFCCLQSWEIRAMRAYKIFVDSDIK